MEEIWMITYTDGSTEKFSTELTLELLCAYLDDKKQVLKIERIATNAE